MENNWCKTFTISGYEFDMSLNGTKILLAEGKYPDNWNWEIDVSPKGISLGVMKTITLAFELEKEDIFLIQFEGRQGDWTEDNKNYPYESLELSYDHGKWSLNFWE